MKQLATLFLFLVTGALTLLAQDCPGDNCTNPIQLDAPSLDETVCAVEVCTGDTAIAPNGDTYVQWTCAEENNGNPLCWSEDHDYWIELYVTEELPYVLTVDADYTNLPFPDHGGVQMAVYHGCACPVSTCWDQLEFSPEYSACEEVSQSVSFDLILPVGTYLIQVDGFGQSFGCSTFCVWAPGLLGLDVREMDPPKVIGTPSGFFIERGGKRYDLAGRRIE